MQKSWRADADKLTFIACASPPSNIKIGQKKEREVKETPSQLTLGKEDSSSTMIGDINLFLYEYDEGDGLHEQDIQEVVGEVEIMVARKDHQGKGLGKEILLTFLWYIISSLDQITSEYHQSHRGDKVASRFKYLRVKIDENNSRSIGLFEGVGFEKLSEKPNFFGELELRWPISTKARSDMETKLNGIPLIMTYE